MGAMDREKELLAEIEKADKLLESIQSDIIWGAQTVEHFRNEALVIQIRALTLGWMAYLDADIHN